MERIGTETRASGQHASLVIKVAWKEEAEKLLRARQRGVRRRRDHGGALRRATNAEASFKCRRFRHRAMESMRP